MKKTVVQSVTNSKVDSSTGEIVEETQIKTFTVKKDSEPFFMTYSKALSILYNIPTAAAIKVLWKLLDLSDFNRGVVRITKKDREEICKSLEISGQTYYNSIQSLKKAGIVDGEGGYLQLNSDIVWKGDSKTREKLRGAGCVFTFKPSL